MDASSHRWQRVTPSTFPWEDEAIDFLRTGVADADPNRAWSNFEFISGGVISEVDVFLLTRKGAFLIEIKSTPGRLVGDQHQWTFHRPDGGRRTMENPLLGANRKAKRIKSLLEAKWRHVAGANAQRVPFIEPMVFLSDPDLIVELRPDARHGVFGRDGSPLVDERKTLRGIVAATTRIGQLGADNPRFRQLNSPTTTAVAKALEAIGISTDENGNEPFPVRYVFFDPGNPTAMFGDEGAPGAALDQAIRAMKVAPVPVVQTSPPKDRRQVVGIKTWYWTDSWAAEEAGAGEAGTYRARIGIVPVRLEIAPGDGTDTIDPCTRRTAIPWRRGLEDTDCGHVYFRASAHPDARTAVDGKYVVRARMIYDVTYRVTGPNDTIVAEGSLPQLVSDWAAEPLTVNGYEAVNR